MSHLRAEQRTDVRYDVLECGMLWKPGGPVPERIGSVVITNASIGGVQLRSRSPIDVTDDLLLQLGSDDGPLFIPGKIRYSASENGHGTLTYGFRFEPKSFRDREAIGKYVLLLKERVCESVS